MSNCCLVSVLVVPFVVASIAGCGRTGGAEPGSVAQVDTLANGAVHVANPEGAALWAEGEGWRLVEDLRIGSLDGSGPSVFGTLGSLSFAVDDDGRMFVLDGQANEIRMFDAFGSHVRTFGRAGAGPGELQGNASLAGWGPDGNLWIADPANARYSVFSPTGESLTSHRREIGFSMYPWPGTIDVDGRILDLGIRQRTRSEHALVRVDPLTLAADTFPLPSYDGGTFSLLYPDGSPRTSVTIPFAGQLAWRRIPSTKPLINDFMVDDVGYLWVWRKQEESEGTDGATYDIFDPAGLYLGAVSSPTWLMTRPRPVFHGDHIYGFTVDDLDVPYLVRLRIEGRAQSGR